MMLPKLICNDLDELCRSLGCSWNWNGEFAQGLSQARTFPIQLGKNRYALRSWNWGTERYREVDIKIKFQCQLEECWPTKQNCSLILPDTVSEPASTARMGCPIPAVVKFSSAGKSIAIAEDSLWTLSTWLPGATLPESCKPTFPQMRSVVQTLATMHSISIRHACGFEPSAGWNYRCERLQQLKYKPTVLDTCQNANLHERTAELIASWIARGLIDELLQFANDQSVQSYPCCMIVRDTHYQNWQFLADVVSGFVDYAAAKQDWFGWDLVRFLSSSELPHTQVCEMIFCYEEELGLKNVVQHSAMHESLAALRSTEVWTKLDAIQTILSLAQWKEWNLTQHLSVPAVSRWRRILGKAEKHLV